MNLEDRVFSNASNSYSTVNSTLTGHDSIHTSFLWPITRRSCVIIYGVLIGTFLAVTIVRMVLLSSFFARTSMYLHDNMFNAITRATMFFFNANSSGNKRFFFFLYLIKANSKQIQFRSRTPGRILNRFTHDMGTIDESFVQPVVDTVSVIKSPYLLSYDGPRQYRR